ncbi:MAG: Asp23/Gls24 family envelope stress response protein [Clostridia bacterium]|nr:Asp23/Gls24 family envelope stress response protein [Clostridia bacterium]
MATKKASESHGNLIYDDSIVQGIVAIAVSSVEGVIIVSGKKSKVSSKDYIKIVTEKDGSMSVSVTMGVEYGYNVPDIAYNVQNSVKQNVEAMTKYKISKVDVYVSDVVFDKKPSSQVNDND